MKFLVDEMFANDVARLLRTRGRGGHDAVHVREVGLGEAGDDTVAEAARSQGRALVTENVADFAPEHDIVLVCIRKRALPSGGAQVAALADLLADWAAANPHPYVGQHWPP